MLKKKKSIQLIIILFLIILSKLNENNNIIPNKLNINSLNLQNIRTYWNYFSGFLILFFFIQLFMNIKGEIENINFNNHTVDYNVSHNDEISLDDNTNKN